MKIELAQVAGRDGDKAYNLKTALAAIEACAEDTQLIVFPETHLSGFPTLDNVAELAEPIDGPMIMSIRQAARARNVSVAIGFAEVESSATEAAKYYNTTVLITPNEIALRYRKTHLWASDQGVLLPGDRFATCLWNGVRVGLLICYDIEFPETARALAQLGAELIIVTNGNMDPYGPIHRAALMARAIENQAFAVMVNRVGEGDGDLTFAGGSMAVDPFGQVLVEAGRDEAHLNATLDLKLLKTVRHDYRYLDDRRLVIPGVLVEHEGGRRELLIP
ncbi:(R)-amidase [Pseudomonas duriflava]|uniref:(R)-amidase n=1 Tax=Pseudomonas duriflava TaxID=459528 RepID=A0A562QFZ4_9PSED|nr:carbon-nitrogen hydrolase family protein [Pseudomonas duriflava]TWI55682.1 (R)-amidase [Pseudomonas duriflava]